MKFLRFSYILILCLLAVSFIGVLSSIFILPFFTSELNAGKSLISFFLSGVFFGITLELLEEGVSDGEFFRIDVTRILKKIFPEWRKGLLSKKEQLELF